MSTHCARVVAFLVITALAVLGVILGLVFSSSSSPSVPSVCTAQVAKAYVAEVAQQVNSGVLTSAQAEADLDQRLNYCEGNS
jgi:hypothetical protein